MSVISIRPMLGATLIVTLAPNVGGSSKCYNKQMFSYIYRQLGHLMLLLTLMYSTPSFKATEPSTVPQKLKTNKKFNITSQPRPCLRSTRGHLPRSGLAAVTGAPSPLAGSAWRGLPWWRRVREGRGEPMRAVLAQWRHALRTLQHIRQVGEIPANLAPG